MTFLINLLEVLRQFQGEGKIKFGSVIDWEKWVDIKSPFKKESNSKELVYLSSIFEVKSKSGLKYKSGYNFPPHRVL